MRRVLTVVVLAILSFKTLSGFADSIPTGFTVQLGASAQSVGHSDLPADISVINASGRAYSGSLSASAVGTGYASASIFGDSSNIGIHALAVSDSPPNSDSTAAFDVYYHDRFYIQTSGLLQWTLDLDAQASFIGNPNPQEPGQGDNGLAAYGGLDFYSNSSYYTWGSVAPASSCARNCGALGQIVVNTGTPRHQTLTGIVNVNAGETIDLGLYMWGRAIACNCAPNESDELIAEVIAPHTGFFKLSGLDFTSASGLTYDTDPDSSPTPVPEPSTLGLLATGLFGIAGALRRQLN